jgi:leader peptidase (prepilin peptidase) / N-methyltransferase
MFNSPASLIASTGLLYLLLVSWPLAKTDILQRRLPNKYVLPAFPFVWLGQILAGLFYGTWPNLLLALITALTVFGLALVVNRMKLLGMGDVKLMAAMALCLGWYSPLMPLVCLLATFLIAGSVALAMLITRRISLGNSMPLGPYLIAGFFAAVTVGVWS